MVTLTPSRTNGRATGNLFIAGGRTTFTHQGDKMTVIVKCRERVRTAPVFETNKRSSALPRLRLDG
jgi:hypothetical protein